MIHCMDCRYWKMHHHRTKVLNIMIELVKMNL
uniref:Uncharacterized protein n=1 Tax=Rhizophora mucronata TaxID=61149 RepID=A0A2P2PM68_RHIMU